MTKRNMIAAGLFVLLLVVAGVYLWIAPSFNEHLEEQYPEILDCKDISDGHSQGICFQKIALDNNDSRVCGLIPNEFSFDECYSVIARRSSDPGYCEKIKNGSRRDGCNFDLALDRNNPDICKRITTDSGRFRCLAVIEKEPSFCAEITNEGAKDWCFYTMSLKESDSGVCGEISSSDIRDKCYLEHVRANKLNSVVCRLIENKTIEDECREIGVILDLASCPIL